jgi:hypothetical protein
MRGAHERVGKKVSRAVHNIRAMSGDPLMLVAT